MVISEIIEIYQTEKLTQTTLTEDNYHQSHQYITIHEAEHNTDHNQGTIIPILEIIGYTKDTENQRTTITEVQVITETITAETEVTATIERTFITNTIIVDQVRDIQTETTQDNNHHITEIIITIITITDKDITAETQILTTNIDNVLVVTIDISQIIITETIGEIHHKENKIKGITLKNDEMKEINMVIITKTE